MKKTFLCAWLCLMISFGFLAQADIVYTLRLSTSNITLSVGESRTITWSVEPVNLVDHKLTWESDNPYVASVDQRGKITARTAGSTYVRATLETGVTRRVNVTVLGNAVTELSVSEQVLELEVGQSAQLSYTITPTADDKRVRWLSDDTSVAKVSSDGRVTAVGGGVATITLLCVNGMTATTVVYVPSDVRSIRLDQSEVKIGVGEEVKLSATVQPVNARNQALSWESSDTSVAVVDQSGLITGIARGECKVGARCENGVYAIASVQVLQYPTSISIVPERLILSRENYTGLLQAELSPADAEAGGLKWSSSDEGVARVDNGVVTAHGYGSAVVTVETLSGLVASAQVDVGEAPQSARLNASVYLLPMNSEGVEVYPIFSPYNSFSTGYTLRVTDTDIAVIDEDGLLRPRMPGTTTLELETDEGLTAKAEIRVYEDIKNLYVSEDRLVLKQYEFRALSFYSETGRPFNGQLAARAEDESVCVYMDGGIYARAPGTTEITFSNPGTTAVCSVSVTVEESSDYPTLLVALTFDNGPDAYTGDILAVLDKYNVRATFFLLGRCIEQRADIAAQLKDTAHELGNHTYDNSSIASQSVADTANALEKTDRLAKKHIGRELTLLRAPDALLPEKLLSSFLDTRRFVGRGVLVNDIDKSASAEDICAYALGKVYNTCMLTFHDAGANTAQALELLLPQLLSQGYRFVTVSELIEYTGFTSGIFSTKP